MGCRIVLKWSVRCGILKVASDLLQIKQGGIGIKIPSESDGMAG